LVTAISCEILLHLDFSRIWKCNFNQRMQIR
jgi:hypothetical protein